MPRVAFTAKTRKYLGTLDAVESVTQYRICYSKEFRDDCMRRYAEGGSPAAIFREAGLDPKVALPAGRRRMPRKPSRSKATRKRTTTLKSSRSVIDTESFRRVANPAERFRIGSLMRRHCLRLRWTHDGMVALVC